MKPKCIWREGGGNHPNNPDACYRNGKKHGLWEIRYASDSVGTGQFVDDKKHGRWEIRLADDTVVCAIYENGELVEDSTTDAPCK